MAAVDFVVDGYFSNISDPTQFYVDINISDIDQQFVLQQLYSFNFTVGPSNFPARTFPDINTAISWLFSNLSSYFLSSVDTWRGTTGSTLGTVYRSLTPEDRAYFVNQATTINSKALTGNVIITASDLSLATVATTGTYSDLIGKPSIPAAQVNSDWSANVGIAQILNRPSIPNTARTTSVLSLSLVGTGATGTQISSTKDSSISCCVSTSTTSTIGGPATSAVSIKICSTNNATEASWTTVATFESDQTITLAVILQSIQVVKGQLSTEVPAGWFVKLVSSGTGTHAEAFVSGQQTIYG